MRTSKKRVTMFTTKQKGQEVAIMFQLKLDFTLENPELPLELDRLLVSFLKASTSKYSTGFYESLYDKTKSVMKPFTFAYFLPGAIFKENKILLKDNQFTMFFSNADLAQMILFFNSFQTMKFQGYPMKNNSMTLTSVRTQKRQEIKETEIIIKLQSSLIVRRHETETNKDYYYTCNDSEFETVLKENIKFFLEKMSLPISTDGFSVLPVKGKKVVANVFGRKVDASIGIYKLCGSPELLNVLYQAGLGARRSEGHGKFEIIG